MLCLHRFNECVVVGLAGPATAPPPVLPGPPIAIAGAGAAPDYCRRRLRAGESPGSVSPAKLTNQLNAVEALV